MLDYDTQVISGHMFDTGKLSFQNTMSGRIQVHSHAVNSAREGTSQKKSQEVRVLKQEFSESPSDVTRLEAAPTPQKIVIKTAKTSGSCSIDNTASKQESTDNNNKKGEYAVRQSHQPLQVMPATAKSKGNKISLKHYKYDPKTSQKRLDPQLKSNNEHGFNQLSQRISKKTTAPSLFASSTTANHRLSKEIQQATMFQQSSISRESSVEPKIPFIAEKEDFIQAAAAVQTTSHQKNKISNRSVNFRQPQQVVSSSHRTTADPRHDKKQSPLKHHQQQSSGKTVLVGRGDPSRPTATTRRQMTNLQNKTQRIFPSRHSQIESHQTEVASRPHHQRQRKLKEVTISSATNLNPSTHHEYMAVEQFQQPRGVANEIQQDEKSYIRSQSQTFKHDAGTQLGALSSEPMTLTKVNEKKPEGSSCSPRQSTEDLYYRGRGGATLPQSIGKIQLVSGESQTDFESPSLTEWKQVPIHTHKLGNSLDNSTNKNNFKKKSIVSRVSKQLARYTQSNLFEPLGTQSKSGSLHKTAQQSEECHLSQVDMTDSVFGHIPIFSEQEAAANNEENQAAEGPLSLQTGEFDVQSREGVHHQRTQSTKNSQKTLFGNYLAKEFVLKRSDLQFGAGAVNKNVTQQQLFTAVHRPQQSSRERLMASYAFNKDLPSTLMTNESEQSTNRQSQVNSSTANAPTNNIMINTGPVTSHTVMLNLFPPATSLTTKHCSRGAESKFHQKSKTNTKEDFRRIKQTYGQKVAQTTRQQTSSLKGGSEASKLKIGSTVISATSSKDKALKYKVQKKESEAQYTQLKFPLSNRRLEATRPEMSKNSMMLKGQATEIKAPRNNQGHGYMHNRDIMQRKESQTQLKIEGNSSKRKFFKATNHQQKEEEEEDEEVAILRPLTVYQLHSQNKRNIANRQSMDTNPVSTMYKSKETSMVFSTIDEARSKLRHSRAPDYSATCTFSGKGNQKETTPGGHNSVHSSVERERQLTQMGHFGPKMVDQISHVDDVTPKSTVSRSNINFAMRQTISLTLPTQEEINLQQRQQQSAQAKVIKQATGVSQQPRIEVKEQKTVLKELKSFVVDSTKQLKDIQHQSQLTGNRSDKSASRGGNLVLQQGSSLMVQVGMQRVIEMQQEYIAALELHQDQMEEFYANKNHPSAIDEQSTIAKLITKPLIKSLMEKRNFMQTTQVLKTTLDKLAKLNKEGYEQLQELSVDTALQQASMDSSQESQQLDGVTIQNQIDGLLCREESLETLGESTQSDDLIGEEKEYRMRGDEDGSADGGGRVQSR